MTAQEWMLKVTSVVMVGSLSLIELFDCPKDQLVLKRINSPCHLILGRNNSQYHLVPVSIRLLSCLYLNCPCLRLLSYRLLQFSSCWSSRGSSFSYSVCSTRC